LTARASAGPSRGADAPTRTTWTREGVVAILAVLGLALAARLIIVYAFPGTGLKFDLDSFHAWAANLGQNGLYGVYDRGFFIDYTPGYLYILYVVGVIGQALGGVVSFSPRGSRHTTTLRNDPMASPKTPTSRTSTISDNVMVLCRSRRR